MSDEALTDHFDTLDLAALTREAERLGYVRDADPDDGLPWWLGADGGWLIAEANGGGWFSGLPGTCDEAAALRWLLRQPEAVARAACYARGVAEERARHEAAGAHACGALYPGPDGGRLVACTARVPGPRFCHIHAKGADNA